MAYYCGECAIWQGSSDVDRYGRRWCSYSQKYEESNQNIYGCRGFVYANRSIITAVCKILKIRPDEYFAAFDETREHYLVPCQREALFAYCGVGPAIAQKIENDADSHAIAEGILNDCLIPAKRLCQAGKYEEAFNMYRAMVLQFA